VRVAERLPEPAEFAAYYKVGSPSPGKASQDKRLAKESSTGTTNRWMPGWRYELASEYPTCSAPAVSTSRWPPGSVGTFAAVPAFAILIAA
jgi:hypothetical protein